MKHSEQTTNLRASEKTRKNFLPPLGKPKANQTMNNFKKIDDTVVGQKQADVLKLMEKQNQKIMQRKRFSVNPSLEREQEKENTQPKYNGSISTRRSGSLAPLGSSTRSFGINPNTLQSLNASKERFLSQEDKDSIEKFGGMQQPPMGQTISIMDPVIIPQTPQQNDEIIESDGFHSKAMQLVTKIETEFDRIKEANKDVTQVINNRSSDPVKLAFICSLHLTCHLEQSITPCESNGKILKNENIWKLFMLIIASPMMLSQYIENLRTIVSNPGDIPPQNVRAIKQGIADLDPKDMQQKSPVAAALAELLVMITKQYLETKPEKVEKHQQMIDFEEELLEEIEENEIPLKDNVIEIESLQDFSSSSKIQMALFARKDFSLIFKEYDGQQWHYFYLVPTFKKIGGLWQIHGQNMDAISCTPLNLIKNMRQTYVYNLTFKNGCLFGLQKIDKTDETMSVELYVNRKNPKTELIKLTRVSDKNFQKQFDVNYMNVNVDHHSKLFRDKMLTKQDFQETMTVSDIFKQSINYTADGSERYIREKVFQTDVITGDVHIKEQYTRI